MTLIVPAVLALVIAPGLVLVLSIIVTGDLIIITHISLQACSYLVS